MRVTVCRKAHFNAAHRLYVKSWDDVKNEKVFEFPAKSNLQIVDLTGAGDLFAAGYLHGIINGMSIEECLNKGTEMSSNIIQKIGARI